MDGSAVFWRDGKLGRRWWLWSVASLVTLAVGTGVGIAAMTVHLGSRAWEIAGDSAFVLSCAASSFAFLTLFVRFARKRRRIFDSLNENAYGIYLVHYAFVSWAQLALLKLALPAMVKAPIVFVSAGLVSWGTVALIRRIPLRRLVRPRCLRRLFQYSFLTTSPPFITNLTVSSVVTSASGSPSTAMMSPQAPGSRVPTFPVQPSRSAALTVAA